MVEQCGGTSHGTTVWWSSGTLMVKQCAGTVEQSWWNSRTVMVGQCGGTLEK